MDSELEKDLFLECEKFWVFWALIFVGGYYGAYTYNLRGGVFCNAQTANIVLFGMNLGNGNFSKAAYYLIPFTAYFSGIIISEILAGSIKKLHIVRWDTILVAVELIAVILLGLMPTEWPDQICQITLNFICAMQFNTFRQAEGVGMATTFCTNHLRQFGSFMIKAYRTHDASYSLKCRRHGFMIVMFALGAVIGTIGCRLVSYRSIWGAGIVLFITFLRLLYADRTYEKDKLEQTPHGH